LDSSSQLPLRYSQTNSTALSGSTKRPSGLFGSETIPSAAISASEPPATMPGEGKSGQQSYPSGSVERSRKDSGFADSEGKQSGVHDSRVHSKAYVDESTMAPDRTVTSEQINSSDICSQATRRQCRSTASDRRSPSRYCQSSISTASPATSMRIRSLSRKSTSSHRIPRTSLLHSATSFHRPSSVYNKAHPVMSIRTSSDPPTYHPAKDPLTFHHNSCRLFQALGPHLPYHQRSPSASSCEGLTGINLNSSRRSSVAARHSTAPTLDALDSSPTDAVPNEPSRPTIMHWTSASSRRREYEEIDESHRGIRGWWRRIAPRWCPRPRSSRTAFYNGDSDTGSVRRYRIELPEEDDNCDDDEYRDMEKTASSVKVTETAKRAFPASDDGRNSWSCFKFRG